MKRIPTIGKYILKGKRVYQCKDLLEWGKWLEVAKEERIVKQNLLLNGYYVSTVFLGLDHNFTGKGMPLVFETMIFDDLFKNEYGGIKDLYQYRYSTWQEAMSGHIKIEKEWQNKNLHRVPLFLFVRGVRFLNRLYRKKILKNLKEKK